MKTISQIRTSAYKTVSSVAIGLVLSTIPATPHLGHTIDLLKENGVFCSEKPVNWHLMHILADRMLEHEHVCKECEELSLLS